ncbi:MAG: PEP-CTERM sorting domain-containing protein [Pirellulaceae bacterium]
MNKTTISLAVLWMLTWCNLTHADLILTLTSGSSSVVVIDESPTGTTSSGGSFNSTVTDSLAGAGIVGYNGAVGSFFVNVTTGISKPLIGPYSIDLNNVSVSGSAGTLAIQLIDTNFIAPTSGTYTALSEFGGTTNGFISSATGGVLDSNAEVGFAADTFQGPFGPGAFSGTDTADVSLSGSFSMNTVVTITHTGAGQITSFDHKFSMVPEPMTCAPLLGLTGLCWLRRRRRSIAQCV